MQGDVHFELSAEAQALLKQARQARSKQLSSQPYLVSPPRLLTDLQTRTAEAGGDALCAQPNQRLPLSKSLVTVIHRIFAACDRLTRPGDDLGSVASLIPRLEAVIAELLPGCTVCCHEAAYPKTTAARGGAGAGALPATAVEPSSSPKAGASDEDEPGAATEAKVSGCCVVLGPGVLVDARLLPCAGEALLGEKQVHWADAASRCPQLSWAELRVSEDHVAAPPDTSLGTLGQAVRGLERGGCTGSAAAAASSGASEVVLGCFVDKKNTKALSKSLESVEGLRLRVRARGVGSMLATPLLAPVAVGEASSEEREGATEQEPLAVMLVTHRKARRFTPDDQTLLALLADVMAPMLSAARRSLDDMTSAHQLSGVMQDAAYYMCGSALALQEAARRILPCGDALVLTMGGRFDAELCPQSDASGIPARFYPALQEGLSLPGVMQACMPSTSRLLGHDWTTQLTITRSELRQQLSQEQGVWRDVVGMLPSVERPEWRSILVMPLRKTMEVRTRRSATAPKLTRTLSERWRGSGIIELDPIVKRERRRASVKGLAL